MSSLITITGGGSTKPFSTNMFTFKMAPPQVLEYKHTIQNGSTSIDRISFKDKFEILLPFVQQTDYNNLIDILQSLSSPFLTVYYQTDRLDRLWDGVTAYASDIVIALTQTAYYNYRDYYPTPAGGGLLVGGATTNLFTNPNGNDNSLTNVSVEDATTTKKNLTISNSTDYYNWGTHSFKADNTMGATYTPEAISSAVVNTNDGRPDYSDSGSIGMNRSYTSYALYNWNPWEDTTHKTAWDVGSSEGTYYPSSDEVISFNNGSQFYQDVSIVPASDTFTFSIYLDAGASIIRDAYYGESMIITLTISAGSQTETKVYTVRDPNDPLYDPNYTLPKILSVTKIFIASAATHIRCYMKFNRVERIRSASKFRLQLSKNSYTMPWTQVTTTPVTTTADKGLLYKAPLSMWGHGLLDGDGSGTPSVEPKDWSTPQAASMWFRSTGWSYQQRHTDKFYLMADLAGDSGNAIYIQDGYIKIQIGGYTWPQYLNPTQVPYCDTDITSWTDMSWHHISVINFMPYPSSGDSVSVIVYLDGIFKAYVYGYNKGRFLGHSKVDSSVYERYFSIGGVFDLTGNPVASTVGNVAISEFNVSVVRADIDHPLNYPSLTLIQAMMEAKSVASYSGLIQYDESFVFYLQGNSTSARIARSVIFSTTFTNTPYTDIFSGSCYILPTKYSHSFVEMVCGVNVNLAQKTEPYIGYTYSRDYYQGYMSKYPERSGLPLKNWSRVSLDRLDFATTSGLRRTFGVVVPMDEIYYICGVQFEKSHFSTLYCDGDQLNCSWSGTAEASTSLRTADYFTLPMPSTLVNDSSKSWSMTFSFILPDCGNYGGEGIIADFGDTTNSRVIISYRLCNQAAPPATPSGPSAVITTTITDSAGVTTTVATTEGVVSWSYGQMNTITIVRNTSNHTLCVYLNNRLTTTHTFLNIGTQLVTQANAYIGSTGPNITTPVYNSIYVASLALYNVALTLEQINQYRAFPTTSMLDGTPSPSYYWSPLSTDLVVNANNKVNADVKRLRKQVFLTQSPEIAHFTNRANCYVIKLACQES